MSVETARNPGSDTVAIIKAENDMALAVNAFIAARKRAEGGHAGADKEMAQHLRTIQGRYWRDFFSTLQRVLAKNRQVLEFTDDERLLLDFGVIDVRMLGGDSAPVSAELTGELRAAGVAGCFHMSEWFIERRNQLLIEDSLADSFIAGDDNYASQIIETRTRILSRLQPYFSSLPGIPAEVSRSMQSGDLDDVILNLGVALLKNDSRPLLLRRRNLWQLREQVIAKARARADGPASLKLFDMLNEVYARDWRERYDKFLRQTDGFREPTAASTPDTNSLYFTVSGQIMLEARQMRMRIALASAMSHEPRPDTVLSSQGPRLTKTALAAFLPVARSFDRSYSELPPAIIVPGLGRGLFAWEIGCVILSLRPLVGPEDSIATAFACQRMYEDRYRQGGALAREYEKRFPGSSFNNEFPVDYRAWLCRLTKGEISVMTPERRAFFREFVGPDVGGPIVPPNLRNIGPQTREIICRRLEKQLTGGDNDVNLHRRLGALYWQQGNYEAAALQFTSAMRLDPNDGETMFMMGMFLRAQDDQKAANTFFTHGADRAADSMWGVYCRDALAGQF
ncbi:MAG: tetratricopeptide repeat protein [Planctomycetota bacterium]|jgi:tetratricopeptide (TPR) repeat protein|nr:tetratricopeptide repeat protein [Planctomycetota bacterium]